MMYVHFEGRDGGRPASQRQRRSEYGVRRVSAQQTLDIDRMHIGLMGTRKAVPEATALAPASSAA